MRSGNTATLRAAAVRGAAAGLVGVAAMTASEKLEQAATHRPNSYIPGRALLILLGKQPSNSDTAQGSNHGMHWGTGAILDALRGVWAVTGIRGTGANAARTVVQLPSDQTVQNGTGVGAPPSTWPSLERRVDLAHKMVYSLVTGSVPGHWIAPGPRSRGGTTSH